MANLLFDISAGIIVGERIGCGGYSDVYKGFPHPGGPGHGICNDLAIKVIRKRKANSRDMEEVCGHAICDTQSSLTTSSFLIVIQSRGTRMVQTKPPERLATSRHLLRSEDRILCSRIGVDATWNDERISVPKRWI